LRESRAYLQSSLALSYHVLYSLELLITGCIRLWIMFAILELCTVTGIYRSHQAVYHHGLVTMIGAVSAQEFLDLVQLGTYWN